jgi:hypothetical protein
VDWISPPALLAIAQSVSAASVLTVSASIVLASIHFGARPQSPGSSAAPQQCSTERHFRKSFTAPHKLKNKE